MLSVTKFNGLATQQQLRLLAPVRGKSKATASSLS